MEELNLGKLQDWIDQGRLDPSQPITMKHLQDSNIVGKIKHGVKVLAKGSENFQTPIKLEISRASKSAIDAIENKGGRVTTMYYNRLALRALLKPEKFDLMPRRARPPPKIIPYYLNFENRGELSAEMQLSQAPFTCETGGLFPSDPKEVHELLYASSPAEE
jgi:large subunit ribosomal protein L15